MQILKYFVLCYFMVCNMISSVLFFIMGEHIMNFLGWKSGWIGVEWTVREGSRDLQDVNIQPFAPRCFGQQQKCPNAHADDESSFWKRNIDHLMAELEARVLQGNVQFSARKLIPSKVCILINFYTWCFSVFKGKIGVKHENWYHSSNEINWKEGIKKPK